MGVSSASSIASTSLALRHPGSLLNLDEDLVVGSPVQNAWDSVFSGEEVKSPRFTLTKKGEGFTCKIKGPTQTKALGAFLSVLAEKKCEVWLFIDSATLKDEGIAHLVPPIERMQKLRALHLNGPFTEQGTSAITGSLMDMDGPIEFRVHKERKGYWGLRRDLPNFEKSKPEKLGGTGSAEGRYADQFLVANHEEVSEETLASHWSELLSHSTVAGEHFYWKKANTNEGNSVECQIDEKIEKPVFGALMPFLFEAEASLKLEVSSKDCDDQFLEQLSKRIGTFTGTLDLALTGSFTDRGVKALTSALCACPGKISNLSICGMYSMKGAQTLTDTADARKFPMYIVLPTIYA